MTDGVAGSLIVGIVYGANRSNCVSLRLPTTRQLKVPARSAAFLPFAAASVAPPSCSTSSSPRRYRASAGSPPTPRWR
jgi:hypothetical protein